MNHWALFRDRLLAQLREHAVRCELCDVPGDGMLDVRVSSSCEDGILLLTEWHIAKHHATHESITPPQPKQHEATP